MKANSVRLILLAAAAGMLIMNYGCGSTPPEKPVVPSGPRGDTVVVKNINSPEAQFDVIFGNIQLFTVANPATDNANLGYSMAIIQMEPQQRIPLHMVKNSEVYYVFEGDGMLKINGSAFILKPGISIYVPPNAKQSLLNDGKKPLKILVIDSPPWAPDREVVLENEKARNQRRKKIAEYSVKQETENLKTMKKAVKAAGGSPKISVNKSQKLIDKNKGLLNQDAKLTAETQELSKKDKVEADSKLMQGKTLEKVKEAKPKTIKLDNPKMDKLYNYKELPQNKTSPSDASLKKLLDQEGVSSDLSGNTGKTGKDDKSISNVEKLLSEPVPNRKSGKKGDGDIDLKEIEKLLKNQDAKASELLKKLNKEMNQNENQVKKANPRAKSAGPEKPVKTEKPKTPAKASGPEEPKVAKPAPKEK